MTQQILSRRTLAKGAAWSVPLAAASATVPAFAASGPSSPPPSGGRCLSEEEAQTGDCARVLQAFDTFDGLRDYGTRYGAATNMNTGFHITMQATCWPKAQTFTIRGYAGGSMGHWIPRPTVVLPKAGGKKFTGRISVGGRAIWGARQGVPVGWNIQWTDSAGSIQLDWTGATVTVPLEFGWKDNGDHVCTFDFKFEMWKGATGLLASNARMLNPRLVLHGQ